MQRNYPLDLFGISSSQAHRIRKELPATLDQLQAQPYLFFGSSGRNMHEVPDLLIRAAIQLYEQKRDWKLYHFVVKEAIAFENVLQGFAPRKFERRAAWTLVDQYLAAPLILKGLKIKVLEAGNPTKPTINAKQVIDLLGDLCTPIFVESLELQERKDLPAMLAKELPTLLHYTRRYRPLETMQVLADLEPLAKKDLLFSEKYKSLVALTQEDLDQWKSYKTGKRGYRQNQPVRFLPGVEENPVGWRAKLEYFFFQSTGREAHKAVQLVAVGGFTLLVFILAVSLVPMLFKSYEVPSRSKAYERAEIVPKFIKVQSKYKGNQLETGAIAFPRCYAAPVVASATNNRLHIENPTQWDAVVALYNRDLLRTVRQAYVRKGEAIQLDQLPDGQYSLRFYLGKDWNPYKPNFCGLHGAFDTEPTYVQLSKKAWKAVLERNTEKSIRLEAPGSKFFPIISASMFFFNKYDIHPELREQRLEVIQ